MCTPIQFSFHKNKKLISLSCCLQKMLILGDRSITCTLPMHVCELLLNFFKSETFCFWNVALDEINAGIFMNSKKESKVSSSSSSCIASPAYRTFQNFSYLYAVNAAKIANVKLSPIQFCRTGTPNWTTAFNKKFIWTETATAWPRTANRMRKSKM